MKKENGMLATYMANQMLTSFIKQNFYRTFKIMYYVCI
jgi:hypothetical protein